MTSSTERFESVPEVDALLRAISVRTGLMFPEERRRHAGETALRLMRGRGLDDVAAYGRLLARNEAVFDELTAELTIGETFFFRDTSQFAILRERFPTALVRTRPADHEIRVWSAGCASGEEAWSLAILFEELGLGRRTRIVGTDISQLALERARAGRYRAWSLRGEAAAAAGTWVQRDGEQYVVSPRLRERVVFEPLNLADESYPERFREFDLVLCRNVLIYFDEATIRRVAGRLYEALAPGGWLIMGASDPPIGEFAAFERLETETGVVLVRPDGRAADRGQDRVRHLRADSPRVEAKETGPGGGGRGGDVGALAAAARGPGGVRIRPADERPGMARTAEDSIDSPRQMAERVRRLANDDGEAAIGLARAGVGRHELDVELPYLLAVLLAEHGRLEEAAEAVRRSLFLDRTLVVGHVLLGTIRRRQGDLVAARRAFCNAQRQCEALADEDRVPLADGASAHSLRATVERHLSLLESDAGQHGGRP